MSGLAADERVCPYCAETIKRAAIKCRWCGSDLEAEIPAAPRSGNQTPVTAAVSEAPSRAERRRQRREDKRAQRQATPADGPEAEQERGPRVLPLLFVLLLAAVAAVAFVVTRANAEETAPDGTVTSNSARAAAMQTAAESTATILSYKSGSFEADAEKAGKLMTPRMREDYLKALAPVKAKVVEQGITLKATVVATSLTKLTDDTMRALVFVNQSTTADGAKNEQLDNNRVLVTMKRDGGDWLVSKMDPF